MRALLTWILAISFIAGLGVRVLGSNGPDVLSSHQHHDCAGHEHDSSEQDHSSDEKCPLGHHHHCGTCLHSIPLGLGHETFYQLSVPMFSRSIVWYERERLPDAPPQPLDKPPLI